MKSIDSVLWMFLLRTFAVDVFASVGDRSLSFRKCLLNCGVDCAHEGRSTG